MGRVEGANMGGEGSGIHTQEAVTTLRSQG